MGSAHQASPAARRISRADRGGCAAATGRHRRRSRKFPCDLGAGSGRRSGHKRHFAFEAPLSHLGEPEVGVNPSGVMFAFISHPRPRVYEPSPTEDNRRRAPPRALAPEMTARPAAAQDGCEFHKIATRPVVHHGLPGVRVDGAAALKFQALANLEDEPLCSHICSSLRASKSTPSKRIWPEAMRPGGDHPEPFL